jgi:phosphoglycolate phosphatase-like HAD superfamily hydrolase
VRLVLFDVDGTLLTASGAGRRALERALREVYGTAGPIDAYDFRGGTDPQIIRDLLGHAGVPEPVVAAQEGALYQRYVEHLEVEIGDGGGVSLYPGVRVVVEALAARPDVVVGLLTGNIEAGARLKLRPTGLWPRFRLGAYGSDGADRRALPAIAARRAEALVGRPFVGADTVIVGDTPRDIDCARAFGATAVAVATGWHPAAELARHGADTVLPDLSETARTLAVLLGESAAR